MSLKPKSVDCSQLSLTRPTVLVVGNEAWGIRPIVEEACSKLAKIESFADSSLDHNVDSLNAGSALGIMLFQLKKAVN
jgi:tRNA G18 (ribose-2'-O)-methylase SpoU